MHNVSLKSVVDTIRKCNEFFCGKTKELKVYLLNKPESFSNAGS